MEPNSLVINVKYNGNCTHEKIEIQEQCKGEIRTNLGIELMAGGLTNIRNHYLLKNHMDQLKSILVFVFKIRLFFNFRLFFFLNNLFGFIII